MEASLPMHHHSVNGGDVYASTQPRSPFQDKMIRYRVLEFAVAFVMVAVGGVFSVIPVHERPIPAIQVQIDSKKTIYARDPSLDRKKLAEQVPMMVLAVAGTLVPILVNLFMNFAMPKFYRIRIIPHDTRDFLLSLAQSASISLLLTQFMKNITGRFRPSFHDMCGWDYKKVWDGVSNLCQDKHMEQEARKSFPSGHSSYAFATLFLLTLYLLGRVRINTHHRHETMFRGAKKMSKLFLCFAPAMVAAWVAITRSLDNWHHYSDILTGSLIGMFSAIFGYSYNYGSIFNFESAGVPYQEVHSLRKKDDHKMRGHPLTATQSTTGGSLHEMPLTKAEFGINMQ
ncbi:hypothetical protein Poli38472_004187 [Pythium oligandrum]|uniref:Phosphatidic acid phosphatase type 2/haloperoxidase domain-containing protein n=1 Tax=Pythium oligandrum TaxID=41045 RepID=A0A8K1FP07_PYTOL|nr:hypothetical protein Poli38472_004187 [Pythium oligandrum]|eukprot:TMW66422.1 hypothetical protein Poli38472_004187 [Pythium oligandrum]